MQVLKHLWHEMDCRSRAEALSDEVIELALRFQLPIAHGSRGSVGSTTYHN